MANFVAPYDMVGNYLPDPKEIPKVPKQWIANVCHTLLKNVFSDWVKEQVEERNKGLLVKKELLIDVDPEIAKAFRASTKTSGKLMVRSLLSILIV